MSPLRLVLVTQRFWPLVGRGAKAMANLAVELVGRQVDVRVLTPRWDRRWPAEITYSGVPVVRLGSPPRPGRRPARYVRSLARWLRQNQGGYDLVYVSMLKHDAYTALKAVDGHAPVVLRAERAGRFGDCLWQLDAGCGRRIKRRCMGADALIGPSRVIERELISAGYPRNRIHYLPNGVPIPSISGAARRISARAAVAEVNPGLRMPEGAPLAIYVGRLEETKGLSELVAAWPRVVACRPEARLWLVGDGSYRETLRSQIAEHDVVGRVFLAGVYDSVEELLAGADLFVLPSREEGPSLALLEAMAAGLPIVATDIPGNRELVANEEHGLLVPVEDVDALSAAISRLLAQRELAVALGAAAREQATRRFGIGEVADAHLALFESLVSANVISKSMKR